MPITGVCTRCRDKLEWRKKYRKYKPLRQPGKCGGCGERNVVHAYHHLCTGCASQRKACAMCYTSFEAGRPKAVDDKEVAAKDDKHEKEFQELLAALRERQRRTVLRKMERGDEIDIDALRKAVADEDFDWGEDGFGDDDDEAGAGAGGGDDDDDDDADDDEEDEDDE